MHEDVTWNVNVTGTVSKQMKVNIRTPTIDGYEYTIDDVRRIAKEDFIKLHGAVDNIETGYLYKEYGDE